MIELRRDELLFIDIDLLQNHTLVGIVGSDLFEHRGQLFAGTAPFSPEVEHDQLGHRWLDDLLAESVDSFLFVEIETCTGQETSP